MTARADAGRCLLEQSGKCWRCSERIDIEMCALIETRIGVGVVVCLYCFNDERGTDRLLREFVRAREAVR